MQTALAVSCLLAFSTAAAEPSLLPDRVDKAIHDRIANGEYPALVIAVVDGDRSAVYAFGKLDNGKAPDADTVFEIGSASKTFTATLLAKSVLDGKLKLDEPVATLLPGFTIPAHAGKTITLANLATQHSGLPRLPGNLAPKDVNDPYADYSGERLKAFLAGYQLTRDPGAKYEYSNLGVGLLGYALAQHAGMSYDALLHREIFDPLGMHRSVIALNADLRAHLASGHDVDGKRVANWNFDALAGAGGIKSTAADMLRFLQANMGTTKTPLYPAMQFAQKPRVDAMDSSNPIGLIWMTRKDAGGDIVWHNGETGGYTSFIGFTADRRHGVVVLTNEAVSADDLGFAILDPKAELASAKKTVAIKPQLLDAYVGSYQLEPNFILKILRDGDQLYAQATGQGAFPIYASANDEFFAKIAPIGISFRRDASQKVASLVLHQGGDRVAPRLTEAQADAAQGHRTMAVDPATLAAYIGHYQLAPGAVFTITIKDGQLMSQLSGQSAFPIFASARDKFFYKVVDAQIDFERDAKGSIVALVLHQNGAEQRAARADSH
jgi:D-alanyl-D-alanine-carboxypeptidase/D-alanyl-D-alanine-endopeptidase